MRDSNTLFLTKRNDWEIVCDFDGTITPFDVTDAILERFAAREWEFIEEEWHKGRITARECMDRQIKLLDVPVPELDAFLDTVPVVAGFTDFVDFCHAEQLSLIIVSDGMDYAIKRILRNHHVGHLPVIANRLRFLGDASYRLEFPYGAPGCSSGVCKCKVATAASNPVLLVGDGLSDCCVASQASFIFAREGKSLERTCVEKGYPYLPFVDFCDVRSFVAQQFQHAYAGEPAFFHAAR